MDDYCGCCGNEIRDRLSALWCERCRSHVGQWLSGHPWEKTYASIHGEDCPFQGGRESSTPAERVIPQATPYCTCGSRDGSHILACGINVADRLRSAVAALGAEVTGR